MENIAAGDGMSDVIAINHQSQVFWIENKALHSWPVRESTKPLKNVFEPGQIPFMREWSKYGGLAFVLLRVDKGYWLLNPNHDLQEFSAGDLNDNAIAIGMENIRMYLESVKV